MAKITWNNQQSLILDNLKGNIVASASAGSGKTTVMLERVIRLVDNNVPIERILILAYNTAIATEIKAKLISELEKSIAENSEKVDLYARQLDNIDRANISTIDSYCSSIIKEYFHLLNIDANFNIMGEMEGKSLLNGIIAKKLREEKSDKDSLIYQLITIFGDQGSLEVAISDYCKFIAVVPDREKWVEKNAMSNFGAIKNNSALAQDVIAYISKRGKFVAEVINNAIVAMSDNLRRQEDLMAIATMVERIGDSKTIDDLKVSYNLVNYPDKKGKILKNETVLNIDEYINAHTLGKEFVVKVGKVLEGDEGDDSATQKYIGCFLQLANTISEEYTCKKASLGAFDFSDLTYWAIKLLNIVGVAEEISARYDSVCVDEYQDANYCQDYIISKISSNNLFLVGDIKQSIYKFRNAEPSILQSSFAKAKRIGGENIAVRLNENYRSDIRVLDFVNRIFNCVLSEECGGINYRRDEQLKEGAKYLVKDEVQEVAEINIFCGKTEKEKIVYDFNADIYDICESNYGKNSSPAVTAEANYVADKINQLVESGQIYDPKSKEFRQVQYRDIAILVKSRSAKVENIIDIISSRGIPIDGKSLKRDEVDSNINYINSVLRIVDNDMQDIPLAVALRGSLGKMSYDDLAQIRVKNPTEFYFHSACLKARMDIKELDNFYCIIEKLRTMSATSTLYELVASLVYECGVWESLGYIEDSEVVKHNVSQFLDKIKETNLTLSQYIKALDSGDDKDYTAYPSGGSNSRVVTSTIHGSKGLEYPIVFLVDCGDRINKVCNTATLKYNVKYGIIADNFNDIDMTKLKSCSKAYYNFVNDEEGQFEAMRLLYVALTRARNMLFISGSVDKVKQVNSPYDAGNFLSWMMYVADNDNIIKSNLHIHDCQAQGVVTQEEATKIAIIDNTIPPSSQFVDYVNYSYPWENLKDLSIKYTVTEINQKDIYEDEITKQYSFEQDSEVISPQRGTNYHKILEHIDFSATTSKAVENQLQELINEGVLFNEDIDGINCEEIARVMNTDIIKYALNNKHLREQKFMLYASASEIFGKDYGKEEILIQGAIDLIILGEEVCLVDFKKTSKSNDKIIKTYSRQIELYTKAIEQALGVKVNKKVILVIGDGRAIEL